MKKYYAVVVGNKQEIFFDEWSNIKDKIVGISGIKYKSFKSKEEAESFLNQVTDTGKSTNVSNTDVEERIRGLASNELIAFVDGSFSDKLKEPYPKKYSYGALIISKAYGKVLEDRLFNSYKDEEGLKIQNVAGELKGVMEVLKWTQTNNFNKITFYYDYEGIEKWVTGEWKAKNAITQEYVNFVKEYKEKADIEIYFEHVKAHSGISYNEQVDKLAKAALNGANFKTNDDGSTYVTGFTQEKFMNLLNEFKNDTEQHILTNQVKENRLQLFWKTEKLTITFYEQSSSLFLQGKSGKLFENIFDLVINNLDNAQKTLNALNSFYKLSITRQFISEKFELEMPTAKSKETEPFVIAILETIIYNNQVNEYRPDYSSFLLPVGRAMEYTLHKMFEKAGVETIEKNTKNGVEREFSIFGQYMKIDPLTKRYVISANRVRNNLLDHEIELLQKIYNWYNHNRHQIAHFPKDPQGATLIRDINEVHDKIKEGEELIEDFYKIFK